MENHIDRSVSNYLIPSRANRVYNRLKRIKQNDSYFSIEGVHVKLREFDVKISAAAQLFGCFKTLPIRLYPTKIKKGHRTSGY